MLLGQRRGPGRALLKVGSIDRQSRVLYYFIWNETEPAPLGAAEICQQYYGLEGMKGGWSREDSSPGDKILERWEL